MKTCILLIIILVSLSGFAQSIDTTTLEKIPDLAVTRSEKLTGHALMDYMDRYAELFSEYGCQELYIREYISPGNEKLVLELYIMKDAPSAFGIYKLSNSGCINLNTLTDFSCQSRHTTTAVYGPLFFAITHKSGTEEVVDLAARIVRSVIASNPQERMVVPSVFQMEKVNKYIPNLKFFEGPAGLTQELPNWVQMLQDVNFRMFAQKIPAPDTLAVIARITFPTHADLTMFLTNAGLNISDRTTEPSMASNGFYHSWYKIDDYKIIFLETQVPVSLFKYLPELIDIQKNVWDWEKGY